MTSRMLRVATAVVLTVIAAVAIIFLRPTALGGSTGYIVVSGSSMLPTLHDGDLVVVRKRDEYAVGDIIAFHVPDGVAADDYVIHRVVGGSNAEGYTTRGDNRTTDDPWRTEHDDVIGARVARIPRVGAIANWFTGPFPAGVLVGAALASAYWFFRDGVRGRSRTPQPVASAAEVVALRIHRRYEAATDPEERVRIRRLAFETAGVLANEHPGFDAASFLRACGTYAYDGEDASPRTRTSAHHQR